MPEKSRELKLNSHPSSSHSDVERASLSNNESLQLSERVFEDISNKIENKIYERLRDAELGQREILRLIENMSSKVDNLFSTSSELGCLTVRAEHNENVQKEITETNLPSISSSNKGELLNGVIPIPNYSVHKLSIHLIPS